MSEPNPDLPRLRERLRAATSAEEAGLVGTLIAAANLTDQDRAEIAAEAAGLVTRIRKSGRPGLMETFLGEYGLSTGEGIALMCLAEALLRVPDTWTIDALIQDKITHADWGGHLGKSPSTFVNVSTWALMLTGRVLDDDQRAAIPGQLSRMVRRMGEPVIRTAVAAAMREMGRQFVLGETIEAGLARARAQEAKGYTYSYDMLGEAARTQADADRYFDAYGHAIAAIATAASKGSVRGNPGLSVKLSALDPRYERGHEDRCVPNLAGRVLDLARAAKAANIGLNIDAEEQDRLDLSLDVIQASLADPSLAGWDGFGVVVQAYGRRAMPLLDWLDGLADQMGRRLMIRLVKGAYWDTEIKRAQVLGLADYPVFTRKAATDVSYLACAERLFRSAGRLYPQFATHNAHTVSAIGALARRAGGDAAFEYQRLHGMGDSLYDAVMARGGTRCRIYAPVGKHEDLLAYLVRRLLENGANSSFVHQLTDESVPPEVIAADPIAALAAAGPLANPVIPAPRALFGAERPVATGYDLTDPVDLAWIEAGRAPFRDQAWHAGPMLAPGLAGDGDTRPVFNPARGHDRVGTVTDTDPAVLPQALAAARATQPAWADRPVADRAACLDRIADAYEAETPELLALLAREAGKTLADGVAEIREAVDFCRYYAARARIGLAGRPRGVFVCISPWNFPLAIFTGQIVAGLVTGNAVLAKPAEQTPLVAARAVALMRAAGVPEAVLQLLPGDGARVGGPLTASPGIDGVCFTGSTATAQAIHRAMAETGNAAAPLIAETGGLNAMIVDSSALPEQAVRDIVASAFQSAGQRCSALRMLYVQDDTADRVLAMLDGAMASLRLGDPWDLATDVGPVIDQEAKDAIDAYCHALTQRGALITQGGSQADPVGPLHVRPMAFGVDGIGDLEREVFGPVLHVARFKARDLDRVIADVNRSGYGLTMGLHTRLDRRARALREAARVGNLYVNRNQVGAVVGVQPFGGEGLSGTGPKAGGPRYLERFLDPTPPGRAVPVPIGAVAGRPVPATDIAEAARTSRALIAADRAWAGLSHWAGRLREQGHGTAAGAVLAGLVALKDHGTAAQLLPGPTGERNELIEAGRGVMLCLGGTGPFDALEQAALAIGSGNAAVVVSASLPAGLPDTPDLPLAVLAGALDPADLAVLEGIDGVIAYGGGDRVRPLRVALAKRPGPILPLITEPGATPALVIERAVSTDTTAAGGNASLLAAAG